MMNDIYPYWSELLDRQVSNYEWIEEGIDYYEFKPKDSYQLEYIFMFYYPEEQIIMISTMPIQRTFDYFGIYEIVHLEEQADLISGLLTQWVYENVKFPIKEICFDIDDE